MGNNELISVIIPIYNAEKYIETCVKSILQQNYKNIEVILVNDGSTDRSEKVCKGINDSRIKYIAKQNGGVSSSRNKGIKEAKGKYILFIDADDYLDSNSINSLMLNNNSTILSVLPVRMIKNNNIKEYLNSTQKYDIDEYMMRIINGQFGGFCWGYLFESSIVKKLWFNENIKYMEDTLFLFEYLKMSHINEIIIPVDNNFYNYINNPTSATNNKNNVIEKINNMFYSLEEINKMTNKKYSVFIENKKIRLLEAEMRFLKNTSEFKDVFDKISIGQYSFKEIRYKIFSFLYNNKIIPGLKFYYFVRKIAKKGI